MLKRVPSDITSIPLKVSVSSRGVTVGIKEAPRRVLLDKCSSEDAHNFCPPLLSVSP